MTYDATNKLWFYRAAQDQEVRYDPEYLARIYREILVLARGQAERVI